MDTHLFNDLAESGHRCLMSSAPTAWFLCVAYSSVSPSAQSLLFSLMQPRSCRRRRSTGEHTRVRAHTHTHTHKTLHHPELFHPPYLSPPRVIFIVLFFHSYIKINYFLLKHIPPENTTAAAAAKSPQSCPTLCDPIDGSPPGSPVPGILQARTLEWVATSFSDAWKWKAKVKSLSRVWLLATPWTAAYQAPPSMGFSRQEYWSGVPLPSPRSIKVLKVVSLNGVNRN